MERYLNHERKVLLQLAAIRSKAVAGGLGTDDLVQLDNRLTSALRSVFALEENYPQLRYSDNFLQLQGALNEAEEQIAASRRAYNAAVTDYNNGCGMFLAALQELLEASGVMASGQLATETELERYLRAREWARRLINREGNS